MIRVKVVKRFDSWTDVWRKLETHETAAGFQDSVSFVEHLVDVCAVADAESDRVVVEGVVFEGQLVRVRSLEEKCFRGRKIAEKT